MLFPKLLYEDNHVLAVNKPAGMPSQKDKSGDKCVLDIMKSFIKEREGKPGKVFMGLPHRLDRPTSGILILAKTSKALSRLAAAFRDKTVDKTYWTIVEKSEIPPQGMLCDWLLKDGRSNSSRRVQPDTAGAREARLEYRVVDHSKSLMLLEIRLLTGRHHQIRVQLSAMGCPVRGDIKYGARRGIPGGGILLHARRIAMPHPVRREKLIMEAPLPDDPIWQIFKH